VFPNFEVGIKFMEKVSKKKFYPTSIRLVDNIQFQIGVALKPADSWFKTMIDDIKK